MNTQTEEVNHPLHYIPSRAEIAMRIMASFEKYPHTDNSVIAMAQCAVACADALIAALEKKR